MCDEIGKDALEWQKQQDRLARIQEERDRMLERMQREAADLRQELERQRQEDEANRVAAQLRLERDRESDEDVLYDRSRGY